MNMRAAAQVEKPQLTGRFSPTFGPLVILQTCHQAELTGTLRARAGTRLVTVGFRRGEIVGAEALDDEGIDTLVTLIEWTVGQFDVVAGPPAVRGRIEASFNWLMLEVCRRSDEARAAEAATAGRQRPA
jgi:hypothetical protein